jgi:hypothetical protein
MLPSNLFKVGDWLYIAPFALLGMVLGIYGFTHCTDCSAVAAGVANAGPVGLVPAITHTLGLIKAVGSFPLDNQHWALFLAQIIMPALAFVSLFKLAVQTIRRDARVLWAQRLKGHTIVCGLGETGRQVVDSFHEAGRQVVVIALDVSTPYAAQCERRHIVVLEGDAGQPGMLKIAGLKRASALVIACGSDGANLEIGIRARDVLARADARPVKILSELRSEWLFDLVKTQNAGALGSGPAEFSLFNLNVHAARHLLRSHFFLGAAPEARQRPHILFAGFGRVATEILLRAARSNFAIPGQKLGATILDERGDDAIAQAHAACSGIREIADLKFMSSQFTAGNSAWTDDAIAAIKANPPLAVIVALRIDEDALNTAIRFRKLLDDLSLFAVPVFVRLREQHRLGAFLSRMEAYSLFRERLIAFGSMAHLTSPAALLNESLDILARASHEVWLAANTGSDSPAAVPWERLAEFHKQANRALADYIPVRLRCCGLRLAEGRGEILSLDAAEIEKLAALEHWRWCTELRSLGWQHSDTRDDFRKLHNRLVDWEQLPEGTKGYNREMARMLPQIADTAGMAILRDRILFAGENVELPAATPGIQLVLAIDPADAGQMKQAQAAQDQGAKLWALLRPGLSPQQLRPQAGFEPQIELFLDPDEWSALRARGAVS